MSNTAPRVFKVRNKPLPRYFSLAASLGIISLVATFIYFIGGFEKSAAAVTCNSGSFSEAISGRRHILTFTANSTTTDGNCTFTVPDDVYYVDYLVVAGGGGGASGGGGAGGLVTSWRVQNQTTDAEIAGRQSPLTVYPGDDINVRVGIGGASGGGGSGWNYQSPTTGNHPANNGNDSRIGSVVATGGGAGGFGYNCAGGQNNSCVDGNNVTQNVGGSAGGSGGGSSYDFVGDPGGAATASTVVGATSRGNAGGQTGGTGGYRAGAGGGGAGTAGGGAQSSGDGLQHIGGIGGAGVRSDITGSLVIYACGGGGGINDNSGSGSYTVNGTAISGGGAAGCTGAGRGSSQVVHPSGSGFNGTAGADDFGHGGGGTDPESTVAGRGGSGIVIIRYTTPDSNCPNNTNAAAPASLPVACPTTISVTAGVTTYRDLDMRGAPYSYSDTPTTTTSLIASPSGMDARITNPLIQIRVLNETNTIIGGTYPVIYQLTTNSTNSESYILVNVIDPNQHTARQIPVDPRATTVDLPSLIVGNVSATQVCITSDTSTAYANSATISVTSTGSETRTSIVRGGRTVGLQIRGSNAIVQRSTNFLRVTAPSGENLVKGTSIRRLQVNVSNTATGGNGSCQFGTSSTIDLVPLDLFQKIRQGTVEGSKRSG
jgi:hypothetical protein